MAEEDDALRVEAEEPTEQVIKPLYPIPDELLAAARKMAQQLAHNPDKRIARQARKLLADYVRLDRDKEQLQQQRQAQRDRLDALEARLSALEARRGQEPPPAPHSP